MKVMVDGKEVLVLSDTQKNVIKNEISEDIFQDDMERRSAWILKHKYERCMARMKQEWMPKLEKNGVKSIPLNNEEFAQLVFQQPDYKSKKQKDDEIKSSELAAKEKDTTVNNSTVKLDSTISI